MNSFNYILLISFSISAIILHQEVNCDRIKPNGIPLFEIDTTSYSNFDPSTEPKSEVRSPVILIPGLEASRVEAKITDKKETRHFFCAKDSDWFLIWLNPEEFIPQIIDCFMDNFKLTYDHKLRRTVNAQGVEIRIPGFGDTHSVEYLSNLEIGPCECD